MSSTVRNPDLRILDIIMALSSWAGKTYCYPRLSTIVRLMRERHGRHLSVRTLCRHLRGLEDQLYIRRRRRHQWRKHIGWTFRSTLYIPMHRSLARAVRATYQVARILKTALESSSSSRVPNLANKLRISLRLAEPPPKK